LARPVGIKNENAQNVLAVTNGGTILKGTKIKHVCGGLFSVSSVKTSADVFGCYQLKMYESPILLLPSVPYFLD